MSSLAATLAELRSLHRDRDGLPMGWTRVAFGDVVRQCTESIADPVAAGVERYVGLEHLDAGQLRLARFGNVVDGVSFTRTFEAGQTLFGKRRVYQRKVAVADFGGVCSGDILVFDAKDGLLRDFLPYVASSEAFLAHALATSAGSLSPRTRWRDLARWEFALPPQDAQRRLADLLDVACRTELRWRHVGAYSCGRASEALGQSELDRIAASAPRREIRECLREGRSLTYGVVQPGRDDPGGVPLIRVVDLNGSGRLDARRLRHVTGQVNREHARSITEAGDVLISVVGTIGRVHLVGDEEAGFNIARAIARVAPDPSLLRPEFLVEHLRSPRTQQRLEAAAFESARKTLNLGALSQLHVPVPSMELQDALVRRMSDLRAFGARATERAHVVQAVVARLIDAVVRP